MKFRGRASTGADKLSLAYAPGELSKEENLLKTHDQKRSHLSMGSWLAARILFDCCPDS